MSPTPSTRPPGGEQPPEADPWAAFGYLVAGVAFYGVIGYALNVWLDAPLLIPLGILVGAAFGVYLVFARYRYRGDPGDTGTQPSTDRTTPIDHDRPATGHEPGSSAERDDRGVT